MHISICSPSLTCAAPHNLPLLPSPQVIALAALELYLFAPSSSLNQSTSTPLLGMFERVPRFVKIYENIAATIGNAAANYAAEVRARSFPGPEQTYQPRQGQAE